MEIVQSLSSCVLEVFLHEGNQGDFVHLFICVFHLLFFVLCLFGFIIGSTFSGQRTLIEELKVFLYPLIPSCAKFIWAAEIPSAAGCRGLQYVCCSGPSPSQFSWRSREKDVHLPCPTLHNENLAGQKSINPILKQETATFFQ